MPENPETEPLTAKEEALYRDGLRDAPTVAGLRPETTTLVLITIAEWADRCRRLLATIDRLRSAAPPPIPSEDRESLRAALAEMDQRGSYDTGVTAATYRYCASLVRSALSSPVAAEGVQPQALDADFRQRAAFLADRAARAVTEPRRFHESALEQHDLGVAAADVRRALRSLAAKLREGTR